MSTWGEAVVNQTCVDRLRARADAHGDRLAFVRWADASRDERHLTYAALDTRARALAAALQAEGLAGERVLLLIPAGLEFVVAYFGCLYAGAVAVPSYPLLSPAPGSSAAVRRSRATAKLVSIAQAAGPAAVLTRRVAVDGVTEFLTGAGEPSRVLALDQLLQTGDASAWRAPAVSADTVAFLQFTSGSTGAPRGVMVTHGNLAHNSELIRDAFGQDERSVVVSWLPPYHDMGLIGGLLQPVWSGGRCVLLTPGEFLQRPRRWFEAITRHRADTSGGPNFAFDLCVRRIPPDQRSGLDLSGWSLAFSGAEPVRAETLDRFARAFGRLGFRREAFFPCYGLAEATLAVTASRRLEGPRVATLDRSALDRNEVVESARSTGRVVVGCGAPIATQRVIVVDPTTRVKQRPGRVGEIWVQGASVAAGYWAQPEATRTTFDARTTPDEGPFLRTGDLGYLDHDGRLSIVGRLRDLVVIRGTNHHPADIEATVEHSHPVIRSGGCAAFGISAPDGEELVVVAELDPRSGASRDGRHTDQALTAIATAARAAVFEEHGVEPAAVQLVAAGAVPRTTSGKIERYACRERHERKTLPLVHAWHRGEGAVASAARREPGTDVERRLAAVWADVLTVDAPALDDDFFEVGGHSLLAITLVDRIAREFDVDVPLRVLMDRSTIERLAQWIEQAPRQEASGKALHCHPEERHASFPLTDVQEAYLFGRSRAFELGGVATQGVAEFEAEDLDVPRLVAALDRLVRRHDMLRAVVGPDGRQSVLQEVPTFPVEVLETSASTTDRDATLTRVRDRLQHSMLPPDRWPLFEIVVVRLGDRRARVFARFDLLVADLHSLRLLWRELGQLYRDPDRDLSVPNVMFRDWVVARSRDDRRPDWQRAAEYWQRRLPTLPGPPQLPYARPLRAIDQPRFRRRSVWLNADTWHRLQDAASRAHVTPTAVLLSAFAEVLGTWSRHPRFSLALTFFNRPSLPGLDGVVGDFTSLLPIGLDTTADSVRALVRRVQDELWEVLDHRQAGGVRVLRQLGTLQGRTAQAVLPVVFTCALGADESSEAPWAWLGRLVDSVSSTPQVVLDHQVQEAGDQLLLTWDAVDDAFPAGMLDEMFAGYRELLDGLAAADRTWTDPVPVVVPADHRDGIAEVNRTDGPLAPATLHGLVLDQAARRPDQPAIVTATGRVVSYGDLERRSRTVARWIEARAAGDDGLVAVMMQKGWPQVVAVLGAVRAGAAYLPIDPALPEERRRHLLEIGRVKLVLTERAVSDSLAWSLDVSHLAVEECEPLETDEPAADPDDWTRLAYVIFTSGSTGLPKGVMIDHRGAVNTLLDLNDRFRIGANDRVFGVSALGFDLSVYDVFGTLAAGGTLVLPAPGSERDPGRWSQVMREHRVTIWNSVPALFEMLVDHLEGRADGPDALRLVWLSGDWIPVALPDRARARWPDAEIISMGGATEGSIWSILYPIGAVDPAWQSIPYGRPLRNQRMLVLDHRLRDRPVGVPGDIYIGGLGVARGYWRDPEKTNRSFVRHPETGQRLYRTGDMGRWMSGAQIEFLGREDGQVKVGGVRIELGEIEHALGDHPAVRLCVVVARHLAAAVSTDASAASQRRLVAYVVPVEGREVTEASLRRWLEEKLPRAMIPTRIVLLTHLPLSANGKVDVNALALPTQPSRPAGPVSERERRVRRLWADTLGIAEESLGTDDNFFDVGGSSQLLVQLEHGLSQEAGRDLSLLRLFENPTIAGMARLVAGEDDAAPRADAVTRAARRKQRLTGGRRSPPTRAREPRSGPADA
jgi:amino acid adenylation domain-containing protein